MSDDGGVVELLNAFASSALPNNASSNALASSQVVHSGACYLTSFTVLNTNAAAQFVLFFDLPGPVPGAGTVPVLVFKPGAGSDKTVAYTLPGRLFRQGIVVANSSTAATLTIGAADCFFDVQFLPLS